VDMQLQQAFPGQAFVGKVHAVEHHVAHLSSAFHVSPFSEAVVVSVDGFGDFASAAWGVGRGSKIEVDDRVYFPHSLGIFYQALTQYIGFPNYGDEYKAMGLAPYGQPVYLPQMRKIVHCWTTADSSLIWPFPSFSREDRIRMGRRFALGRCPVLTGFGGAAGSCPRER